MAVPKNPNILISGFQTTLVTFLGGSQTVITKLACDLILPEYYSQEAVINLALSLCLSLQPKQTTHTHHVSDSGCSFVAHDHAQLSPRSLTFTADMFSKQQLLRQVGYLTSAATATAKAPPKHSSQANFGSASASSSHSSHSVADGHSHGDSESESAHVVCFSAQSAQQLVGKLLQQRSQDIQRFIHTQSATGQRAKATQHHPQQQQQTTTKFAMSSLAAEPLQAHKPDEITASGDKEAEAPGLGASCHDVVSASASAGKKPCFNTGLGEILQFMELIGNLKVKETSSHHSIHPPVMCVHRFFPLLLELAPPVF